MPHEASEISYADSPLRRVSEDALAEDPHASDSRFWMYGNDAIRP
jgi:hypothetical protein